MKNFLCRFEHHIKTIQLVGFGTRGTSEKYAKYPWGLH
jgi:hypothetical protein